MTLEFQEFPKMARWSRDVLITEKIDGTNAAVVIVAQDGHSDPVAICQRDGLAIYAQSRTRFITPADDNYGFAAWVLANAEELAGLGEGRHFGEWWGRGIQRNYSQTERRFSLFNVLRWTETPPPACVSLVPLLYHGPNHPGLMEKYIRLLENEGSRAAPGFMNPEGVVMFHIAGNVGFKKTIHKDEMPKALAERVA